MKRVRIGGGQGFWGDSPDGTIHLVKEGDIQYLGCDYLAELTLSIMQRQKLKNPKDGYAKDFIKLMETIAEECKEKNIRVISNAGGMNIVEAVNQLSNVIKKQNIKNYKIGYVLGDDIKDRLPELMKEGLEFRNIDTGHKIDEIMDRIVNVNVYYGHEPLKECIERGADTVIVGRCTDSALFLAPLAYEFKWQKNDYDKLARGIMAGHMLECGGQVTGGNYDFDWRAVHDMDNLGYPIVEMTDDSFYITKTEKSGGLVTEESCKEQILYEVHDPSNYMTPDVVVDLSRVELEEVGKDKVEIKNIRGRASSDKYKLSVGYHAGFKVVTHLAFAWPDAYEKAQYAADIIMKKMKRKNLKVEDMRIDYIGLNSLHLGLADTSLEVVNNLNEVVLRIAIRTLEKEEAYKIVPEIAPLQLNGPPGASFFGGRARIQEVIALWPTFIPKDAVKLTSHIREVE